MTEAYYVKEGDIIFIHTVAGGLGLAFTAYAKSRGATVIGTTSNPEKAAIAKSYGADHVILYTKEDTVQRVMEITNGQGVNAIFDGVGKDTYVNLRLILCDAFMYFTGFWLTLTCSAARALSLQSATHLARQILSPR